MTDSRGTTGTLVRAAAQRLLDVRIDEIVEIAVRQTIGDEPVYTEGLVSHGDLRFHMERTMRLALTRLAGADVPDDLRSAASEVGRLRAEQGVPLSSVLHAFRLDLKTLWEAIIAEGRAVGARARVDFLEQSTLMVWETVEANTEEVVRAYRIVQENLSDIRSAAWNQLLLDGDRNARTVNDAEEALGLPRVGRYTCVVGLFVSPRTELVTDCASRLERSGREFYFDWFGQELRGIVRSGDVDVPLDDGLAPLGPHMCTLVDVDELSAVPAAIRLARMAVKGRTTPGLAKLQDDWLTVVASANEELSNALHGNVFGPLERLTEHERGSVLESVGDLVEHGGTIADIAARTYRHRNTVRKRLQTFTALTGLDLALTKDLATTAIAFAIEARRRA